MIDDATLLHDYAVHRSETAFSELVRRHVDLVYGAAFRRTNGDAALADDIVQQVFSTLAQNAAALRHHTLLSGWLYVTTRHAASTALRAERRRKLREQTADLMPSPAPSDPPPEWSQIRSQLDAVIDELGERDRDAVLLRFIENRPFAEIGAALSLSEDAARRRVDRALDKLRALLTRRGITSTGSALAVMLSSHAAMAAPSGLAATVTGTALGSALTPPGLAISVTTLSLMKTSKLAVVSVLALTVTLGTAVHEVYAAREAEAALAAARRDSDLALANFRSLRQQADTAERAVAALQQSVDAARAAAVKSTPPPRPRMATAADNEPFLDRHPEVRRAAIEQWRAEAAGTYGPLLRELSLTPAQIELFKDLSAQGVIGISTGPNGEAFRYSTGGDRAEARRQLQDLLGEEGYRRYQNYGEIDAPAWQSTLELAASLYDTSTPLTADQGQGMRRILRENRVPTDWSPRPRYDWARIMAQAGQLLSAPQLSALNAYRAADEFNQATLKLARPGK